MNLQRGGTEIMLDWIDHKCLIDNYLFDDTYSRKYCINLLVNEFFKKYPTPEEWLLTPITKKETVKIQGYTELNYIICWAWDKKLFIHPRYSLILLEYFLHRNNYNSRASVWFARKLKLLTEYEITIIQTHKQGIINRISTHCLFLMKPFSCFEDEDIHKLPQLFDHYSYNSITLQNIRLKLRYSNIVPKRNIRQTNWDTLININKTGYIYEKYYEYLVRCNARNKYIGQTGSVLITLNRFIEKQNLNDCSTFDSRQFIKLTEYLAYNMIESSVMVFIAKIKKFFEWGTGVESYFPYKLDYPITYWRSISRKAKEKRKNSNGRAFSEAELANQIVKIIYDYSPNNEIELLCRAFWLIIATCPARFSYILNLDAVDVLQPLPNEPTVLGIYSKLADKAGNRYGQFPILDYVGVKTIRELIDRTKNLEFEPIKNANNNESYIHLFQMTSPPWILDENMVRNFFEVNVKKDYLSYYSNSIGINATAHSFRHHLLTHIALITGDIAVVQTAAGHETEVMTREYLKSKVSRNALLFRVIDKYEAKQITGKFYLRLIELLSNDDAPVDQMLIALTTEMKLDEFINLYGKKLDMGYCFYNSNCSNWLKCWSCVNFLITREEICQAIKILTHQIISLREIQKNSKDFSYDHPIINKKIKTISLIFKRLSEFDITEDQIIKMIDNLLQNKSIDEEVLFGE